MSNSLEPKTFYHHLRVSANFDYATALRNTYLYIFCDINRASFFHITRKPMNFYIPQSRVELSSDLKST